MEPLLGDTSIQGTQKPVPEKCSHNLSYSGEWGTFYFAGPETKV